MECSQLYTAGRLSIILVLCVSGISFTDSAFFKYRCYLCKATVIVSRLRLLRLATLLNMTERGYKVVSKRSTAWLKCGTIRAGMLQMPVLC